MTNFYTELKFWQIKVDFCSGKYFEWVVHALMRAIEIINILFNVGI